MRSRNGWIIGASILAATVVVAALALPFAATFGQKIVDRVAAIGDDAVLLPGLVDTHVHVNEPG